MAQSVCKGVILVDMDSTIAHFFRGAINKYIAAHPNGPYILEKDITDWDFYGEYKRRISEEAGIEINRMVREKGFTLNMEPIEGAVQALNEMLTEGYEVFICTAPPSRFEDCVVEKYQWVLNHMGRNWTDRLILTRDKTLIQADVIIDDKPHITGLMKPSWTHILFTQSYNILIEKPRVTEWSKWKEVVEEVIQSRKAQ